MTLRNLVGLLSFVIVAFFASNCDSHFDPIEENNRYFSIFGYLNASADTQFVRVEKLRDNEVNDAPLDFNVEVSLTNITTGQTKAMQDSVFEYYLQGKAHNFYTTMPINPEHQYKLQVIGSEGTSSAIVQIPNAFPKPNVLLNNDDVTSFQIQGVSNLIAVKSIYYTCQDCCPKDPSPGPPPDCPVNPGIRRMTFSHLADTVRETSQSYKAEVNRSEDRNQIELEYPMTRTFTLTKYEVVIVAGSEKWPNFQKLDERAVALPDIASNVEGGVGLLGGIISDTIGIARNRSTPCTEYICN